MALRLATRFVEGVAVVYCVGRIVAGAEADEFRLQVKGLLPENTSILINLRDVEYVDSGGLGALVGLYVSARNAGGELKVCCPNQRTRHVLNVTKLAGVLKVFSDEEQAVASFRRLSASA